MAQALIVEDHEGTRESLAELIRGEGFDVVEAADLSAARDSLEETNPDLVILDIRLPDGSGMDLVSEVRGEDAPEFVLVTGNASLSTAVEALRQGVADYLTKPVDVERLRSILRGVERASKLRSKVRSLRGELRAMGVVGKMVGRSEAMERVFDMVTKVAPTAATVLLTGRSGTGKEVVARSLHDLSERAEAPFVPVNCGAVPSTLMESQLFGHEKGAFTGADSRHRGYFEQADRGTLFLDEITEMSGDLQVKLLRVLENRSFMRVGGESPIDVNVRLVTATNRDPEQAVRDGKLREDLYYRLRVIHINLPPLKNREGDVRLLADHFLQEMNQETGADKRLTEATYRALESYGWPGNVRELKNALQSAYILSDDIIEPDSLPTEINGGFDSDVEGVGGEESPSGPTIRVRVGGTIADAERRLILRTLDECGGNRTKTAEVLGVSVKTLYNRLKAYEDEEEAAREA